MLINHKVIIKAIIKMFIKENPVNKMRDGWN